MWYNSQTLKERILSYLAGLDRNLSRSLVLIEELRKVFKRVGGVAAQCQKTVAVTRLQWLQRF
jgi:hypothetical protein